MPPILKTTAAQTPAPVKTPDNTPPPGGGRWRWDISLPGWVDADAIDTSVADASPEPTPQIPQE